jgi:Protein of unknown function (DUF3298)/Deacetylase PdaC
MFDIRFYGRMIAILSQVAAICSWASTYDQALYAASALPAATGPSITVNLQEHELIQHDDWWSIDIKYPVLEGDDDFNVAVRQHVNAMADEFTRALPKTASKGYPDYGAYLKGTYAAQVLKNGVVAVLFEYSEYTPGAAHPWGTLASINYDARVRRMLALSDLFRARSGYVSRLSRFSIKSLDQRQYADKYAIRRGAGPVEKNFKVFTLTDTDLVLHFEQYQVAAGAMPSQEVVIPLTRLAPLLRRDYLPVQ